MTYQERETKEERLSLSLSLSTLYSNKLGPYYRVINCFITAHTPVQKKNVFHSLQAYAAGVLDAKTLLWLRDKMSAILDTCDEFISCLEKSEGSEVY